MLKNNINKTISYLKRNGLSKTISALTERLAEDKTPYERQVLTREELNKQRETSFDKPLLFDILVPAYHTDDAHFRDMITSVAKQTYSNFRLLIGDGGREERLKKIVDSFKDDRIIYYPLEDNGGISENTNAVLRNARGDYIVLLDHDDLLEPDALFRFMEALEKYPYTVLYSDEDKCDSKGTLFYEPNFKPDFDPELLMSNNYICHLTCVKREMARSLGFRKTYDGAQDHDFLLRACDRAGQKGVAHINRVLYHWRCHEDSTAANPDSKRWAYEAGRACVEDFCRQKGWEVSVSHTEHLGFFRVDYKDSVFNIRDDVGAVCGPIYSKGRLVSGAMDENGRVLYLGLKKGYAGYMKRAKMVQTVQAGDPQNMVVRPELEGLSCKDILAKGYKILYDPLLTAPK